MDVRMQRVDELGWGAPAAWLDVMVDMDANAAARELYGELVRRNVGDADTAASLVPTYPMGCKRPVIDSGYFETFNRPNVSLVDLRKGAIVRITPDGIETEQGAFGLDVILFATGFDAMTGALNRIDIRGRDGMRLKDFWIAEGPKTYLGLQVVGFPNLFTVTGPGSPSVASNMIVSIEQHVEWIADCLVHLREQGLRTIEATAAAQDAWVEHVAEVTSTRPVAVHPTCNSWYVGANVPGKRRVYMPYVGGLPRYRQKCDDVAAAGYEGFTLT
jgi:cyclohexanone monooxygenase